MSRGLWSSVAGVAVLWALCTPTPSWSAETKRERAARYYRHASQLLKDFRRVSEPELGPRQYLLVAKAFRNVYLISPTSGYCDDSLLVEAEMYRKAADRFQSEKRRADALKTYRFLAREYPHSELRLQALQAIAEMEGRADPQLARNDPPVAVPTEPPPIVEPAPKKTVEVPSVSVAEPVPPTPIPVRHESKPGRRRGGPVPISDVRFWSHHDSTRIVIDIEDATRYRSERLSNPDRLFVDLSSARLGSKFSRRRITTLLVKDDRVRQIRVAQNRRTIVRLVFDLEQPVRSDFQWLTNPERLVVELRSAAEPPLFAEERRPSSDGDGRERAQVSDLPQGGESDVATPDSVNPTSPSTSPDAVNPLLAAVPGTRPSAASGGFSPPPERFAFDAPSPSLPTRDRALPAETPPTVTAGVNMEVARSFVALARAAKAKLELLPPLEQPEPAPAADPEPALIARLEPPEPAPTLELAAPPKAAKATSRGKRNMIRALGLKVGRVVIDAGHGGHDTGSIGKGGLREKDLVVDISRRLGDLIQTNLGADVIYTRTTDRSVSLKERTKLANDSEADLFISIHANSSRLRSIRGVETYYLSFTANSWALGVASRENAAAQRSVHELESLLSKIALTEKIEESREFAGKVQKSLYTGLSKQTKGLRNRGVRKAPFMVLVGTKMPAVLAEVGFLSNPHDEKLLKSSSYRQKIANHLFEGVRNYSDTLSKVTLTERTPSTADGVD